MILTFVQILTGVCLIVFMGIAMSQKTKRGLRIWTTTGAMTSAAHYWLLGLPTAGAINTLSMASNWVLGAREDGRDVKKIWALCFMAASILLILPTWHGWTSVLPATANVVSLGSMWFKNPRTVLWTRLFVEPVWLWYNVANLAWLPMLASVTVITAIGWNLAFSKKSNGCDAFGGNVGKGN